MRKGISLGTAHIVFTGNWSGLIAALYERENIGCIRFAKLKAHVPQKFAKIGVCTR